MSCWGRAYGFDGTLLPTRISSQERNILAGPVKLAAVIDGRELKWKHATFKPGGESSEAVAYGTGASAAGVAARCEFATEFDGCTRVEVTLESPASLKLDSLDLVVPLKPAYAQFFHHSSTLPVFVWDWPKKQLNAGRVGAPDLKLPFVYFIWLGSDEGGLQVFSESDPALSPAEPAAVVTVSPGRDASVLRMHLLSNYTLNGSWHWTFGFMATPVKPHPRDISSLRYCQMGGYGIEDHYWGDKPPTQGYPPALDLLKASGVNYVGFHENWSEQQSLPRPNDPTRLVSLIDGCHKRGMGLVLYTGCWADMFRISAYVQEGRGALLVVANLGTNQATATVTLRRNACGLGARRLLAAKDESAGQALAFPRDTLSVPVNEGSFRLISVQAR